LQKLYEEILQLAINELDQKYKEIIMYQLQSLSKVERKNFVTTLINDADIVDKLINISSKCSELGVIHQTHERMNQAVQMYKISLKINEILDRKEDMARAYGSLGFVYQCIGEADKAVQMYEMSLKINNILGRKVDMARVYGNLGFTYHILKKMDKAVQMYNKNLKMNVSLNRKEGMPRIYSYLGYAYQALGKEDKAVEMWHICLKIKETLDRKKMGMLSDNTDIIYETRKEIDRAVQIYKKRGSVAKFLMGSEYPIDLKIKQPESRRGMAPKRAKL
jgi:tetratricopeptide (TPR) repeat protein